MTIDMVMIGGFFRLILLDIGKSNILQAPVEFDVMKTALSQPPDDLADKWNAAQSNPSSHKPSLP